MRFHSTAKHPLSFEIKGWRYQVPVGGEVEIDRDLEYVPAARGLPLAKGTKGGDLVEPVRDRGFSRALPQGVRTGHFESASTVADDGEVNDEAPAVSDAIEKLQAEGALPKGKKVR